VDTRNNSSSNINLWNNTKFHLKMLDNELLQWLGNFINFTILVYITSAVVNTGCFSMLQLSITTFGLVVSIIINIYTSQINKNIQK